MKKHSIIPIFIPHKGCPNDCVFCNQKKITARQPDITQEDVENTIITWLSTLENSSVEIIEVAFFGGSFTGLSISEQSYFLEVAKKYKDAGRIHKIHLSTRPDYINQEILDNLKAYGVDTIELGVQSLDDEVLRKAGRGHDSAVVYKSSKMIKDYGFELGIQLMIGLPGDTLKTCIYSAKETVKIGPSIARLYPTIVIEETQLYEDFVAGRYEALSQDEAVYRTKIMYKILTDAGINIIRVGLKSSDIINENGQIGGGTFHPAFRQLVEGELARDEICRQADALIADGKITPGERTKVDFYSCRRDYSNLIGNSGKNKQFFLEKYPNFNILYKVDDFLRVGQYRVEIKNLKRPVNDNK